MSARRVLAALALALLDLACSGEPPASEAQPRMQAQPHELAAAHPPTRAEPPYDPLAHARATLGKLDNLEAPIPPQCYTKTEGRANPCWVCHAPARFPNAMVDWDLQGRYSFSDAGKTNYWTNLFVDRQAAVAAIGDAEILAWIRTDNYAALREYFAALPAAEYRGYRPDLDYVAGFDAQGFAHDGSGWRAIRYKPFAGAFWPTNGSSDDVLVRLPAALRRDAEGHESRAITIANLAIVEASLASDPRILDADLRRPIEPVDERAAGIDLDGDGVLEAEVVELVGLPTHYAGPAKHPVRRGLYPEGTEFLHAVRYVDPERDWLAGARERGGASLRMKELRYMKKFAEPSDTQLVAAYAAEAEEKREGNLPRFFGSPLLGLKNDMGWQLQAFIEDEQGRLRMQTEEELYACMGCHTNLGVTADQTFALPRKLPGAAGWRMQDLVGMPDAPQLGHARGELAVYLERARAGDEFRSNAEMLRFFAADGSLDDAALVGDLHTLLMPSHARALVLAKAYLVIVREQSFVRGRDPVVAPLANVHAQIVDESTGLSEAERVYLDGTLRLAWP